MDTLASNVTELPRRLPQYGDAHVPPGEYAARFVGCETWARIHGWAPRVVLVFALVDPGYVGTIVPGFYRVVRLHGKPRRNGRFAIGSRSRLWRDLTRMLDRRAPTDRVPVEALTDRLYSIMLRDVETDCDEHPLGTGKYSAVDWIKGRI